jgi:hypothetical protein
MLHSDVRRFQLTPLNMHGIKCQNVIKVITEGDREDLVACLEKEIKNRSLYLRVLPTEQISPPAFTGREEK